MHAGDGLVHPSDSPHESSGLLHVLVCSECQRRDQPSVQDRKPVVGLLSCAPAARLRTLLAASRFVLRADLLSCNTATRLRIPLEEYPGYNFIGLIIGPRGNTHRRLEQVRLQDRLQDRRQHAER